MYIPNSGKWQFYSRFCGIIDWISLVQFLSASVLWVIQSLTIGGIIAVLAIAVENADPFIVRIFWSKIYLWYYK
jgi:hypothetical protein